MDQVIPYTVSPLNPSELSLVLAAWHDSLVPPYNMGPSPDPRLRNMRKSDAHKLLTAEIDDVLARYPLMLCARHDGVVLGYIVAEASDDGVTVHYAYVKSPFRRQGIARDLLRVVLAALGPLSGPELLYTYQTNAEPTARRYGFSLVRGH